MAALRDSVVRIRWIIRIDGPIIRGHTVLVRVVACAVEAVTAQKLQSEVVHHSQRDDRAPASEADVDDLQGVALQTATQIQAVVEFGRQPIGVCYSK